MAKDEKNNINLKDDKNKVLELAIKHIQKEYGEGYIMRMGDHAKLAIETITTGSLYIDSALGVGGLPKGRVVEVYGPEASGKTTIALQVIAQAQKRGGTAAFIDAEHALDPKYAANLGVKVEELLISQPDNGEQALEIADVLVRSGAIDVIVVDSVAALVPKAEIEGEMGDTQIGLQARLMSQALRKLTGNLAKSKTLMIFINQIREKVATFGFGPSETTSGGRALKFYASVRLDVRRIGSVKQGDQAIGNEVKVKVTKNKVAPPFKEVVVEIIYGKGISTEAEILDMAVDQGLVTKVDHGFSIGDRKLGQGKESVKRLLEEDKNLYNELRSKATENLKKA